MNYGLYLSASGVLTNSYRQDVFANNLANVETIGFKPDVPAIRQRRPEAVEDPGTGSAFRQRLLERLGGGVLAGPQRIDFTPAPLKPGGDLDVALRGENAFFAVRTNEGGQQSIRLTRDGRLSRDPDGYLVTAAGNHRLLDTHDRPIQLGLTGPMKIDPAGRVIQDGETIAQIQVTGVNDLTSLRKQGSSLFAWTEKSDPRIAPSDPTIKPGYVESSGVDPIRALMDMISATKEGTANGNLIRYQDQLMDRAVNTFGRVA